MWFNKKKKTDKPEIEYHKVQCNHCRSEIFYPSYLNDLQIRTDLKEKGWVAEPDSFEWHRKIRFTCVRSGSFSLMWERKPFALCKLCAETLKAMLFPQKPKRKTKKRSKVEK